MVADPHRVGVYRLRRQLHPFCIERTQRAGHLDRPFRGGHRGLRSQLEVGGETPGALDDHPDGQPEAGRVLRHRDSSIAQPDQLLASHERFDR